MGRAPCCDKANVKKGPWSPEEDAKLKSYIDLNGTGGNWIALPQKIGLKRCGKSCRLRWLNYLRPNIRHGGFSEEEDNIICSLYMAIGSRWSIIAAQLPGRTDNDIKNYWNTRLKKKLFGKQRTEQWQVIKQETTHSLTAPIAANMNQHAASYWPELQFSDTSSTIVMYPQDQTYVNSVSSMFSSSSVNPGDSNYLVNNMFEGFADLPIEMVYGNEMGSLDNNGFSSVESSSSWGNTKVSSLDYYSDQLVSDQLENCSRNLPRQHSSFEISSYLGPH